MRVLVCGGREYGFTVISTKRYPVYRVKPSDVFRLFHTLDTIHVGYGPILSLAEGCAAGADFISGIWAASRGIELFEYPADWDTYGGAAGPKRNQYQLDAFKPNMLVAFSGGRGTQDMVSRAYAAKVEVRQFG
jgi:hypothetical protein